MSNAWKFHQQWRLTGRLQTVSSLHIGSGDTVSRPDLVTDDGLVEINAVVTAFDNRPCIPGSALKGNLLAWLRRHLRDKDGCCFLLYKLFGRGPLTVDGKTDQGSGGRVEFLNARLACPRPEPVTLPYWNSTRQTSVEISVAIDHHTRTTEEKKLIHREVVPPGVHFSVILQGALSEDEIGLLLAAMEGFNHDTDPLTLGAHTANGLGRLSWELATIEQIGRNEVSTWLQAEKRTMSREIFTPVQAEQCSNLLAAGRGLLKDVGAGPQLELKIAFDGPFLVNDPPTADERKRKKEEGADIPDHRPLRDVFGHPHLPEKSVRGALRAQAARIVRTLGGTCCEGNPACTDGVQQMDDIKKLCPVCRLFGAPGWKSVVTISDFIWTDGGSTGIRQDFVAIDRFTGGAMDKAKFDADYVYAPVFRGILSFDTQRPDTLPDWGKGLLALVLRDLEEGDITFGFGRAKGYGAVARVKMSGNNFLQDENHIKALHKKVQGNTRNTSHAVETTTATSGTKEAPQPTTMVPENTFHNPYHFIPVPQPDTRKWLPKEKFAKRDPDHHTHARYFDSLNGKKIYNGRLLCRLETETPLFIGGARSEGTEPLEIAPFLLDDEPAIPATSLRGMLSSLVEAASNSSLRVLEDGTLSFRKEAAQALRGIGLIVIKNDRKRFILPFSPGKVTKLKNAYTKTAMCQFLRDKHSWSPKHNHVYYVPKKYNHKTVPCKSYKKELQPGILRILGKDKHRESMLENKKHELFLKIPSQYVDTEKNSFLYEKYIIDNQDNLLILPQKVWNRFHDLADERTLTQKNDNSLKRDKNCTSSQWLPFHLKGTTRKKNINNKTCSLTLQHADLVYYKRKEKKVAEVSFSSIWRGRVEKKDGERAGVHDFFRKLDPELLPFSPERKKISPAELLFGFVEDKSTEKSDSRQQQGKKQGLAFAGKVRVSFGRPAAGQNNSIIGDPITLKVLATPKPPSPALYFKKQAGSTGKNRYISKASLSITDGDQPQGRKIYLHALRDNTTGNIVQLDENGYPATSGGEHPLWPWESKSNHYPPDKKDERANLKARITPLREKTVFYFHIDFDNLSRKELELLCFALRPFDSFRHRLGMGKPIGLGSVRIDPVGLFLINRQRRYLEDKSSENRYNESVWKCAESSWDEEWAARYQKEQEVKTSSDKMICSPENMAAKAAENLNADIRQALRLLGDPHMVTAPVHYPQVRGQDIEEKNFQWFVANDKGTNKKQLKPLMDNPKQLPGLTRYE